ncbi:MAG: hypothetical protein NTV77_02315 [Candidatus Azambacteria bacterium]|nr:hypothetical protein [Candidatus Azambacteria bacterium]
METYKIIKKFLAEGGRCVLIENDKPIGVVLTIEEYEFLQSKSQISNLRSQTNPEVNDKPAETVASNPIGEAMAKEMDFPGASAEIADIEATDDVTLGDLGVDELPY